VSEDWLEVGDERIDAREVMRRVRERMESRDLSKPGEEGMDPQSVAEAVRKEVIGEPLFDTSLYGGVSIWDHDCDLVPHDYVIDWRMPVIGPAHALVRRVINDELRRYLARSLDKQSHLNRQVMHVLQALVDENAHLRREIEALWAAREDEARGTDTPV
jgi:hypothetical protein